MNTRPSFEMSSSTRLLRQRLREVPIGETVSYADLGIAAGHPVDGGTPSLRYALRSLVRDDQMVFGVVRKVGFQRLTDEQIVSASDADTAGLRRKAKRAAVKITAVQNYAAMTPKSQLAHTTRLSIFTAVASMASDQGIKRVETVAKGRASELPISETLRAFMVAPPAPGTDATPGSFAAGKRMQEQS
jgi:hypothetical protein